MAKKPPAKKKKLELLRAHFTRLMRSTESEVQRLAQSVRNFHSDANKSKTEVMDWNKKVYDKLESIAESIEDLQNELDGDGPQVEKDANWPPKPGDVVVQVNPVFVTRVEKVWNNTLVVEGSAASFPLAWFRPASIQEAEAFNRTKSQLDRIESMLVALTSNIPPTESINS